MPVRHADSAASQAAGKGKISGRIDAVTCQVSPKIVACRRGNAYREMALRQRFPVKPADHTKRFQPAIVLRSLLVGKDLLSAAPARLVLANFRSSVVIGSVHSGDKRVSESGEQGAGSWE